MERLAFNTGSTRREVTSPYAMPPSEAAPEIPEAAVAPGVAGKPAKKSAVEARDWAFTWTLVFTAVLFLRPQDIFPPLQVLHLAELSALAGLVSLITGRLGRGQSLTRMTPEFVGVLLLGAIILVTAPFSVWFGGAVTLFTDQYLKVTLVYLLAVNVITSPKRIERLTWILVLVITYSAFRAVLDYARGVNMIARGTRVQGSVGGLMQNPNDLALHMVVFLPFAFFSAMRPDSPLKRLIAVGAGVLMMGAIVASGSRGGFLGLAATVLVIGAFAARQRPAMVVAGAFAVMCALPLLPSQYWYRIASITDSSKDDYQSSDARRELMREGFQAFLDNPITGVGAGQFKDYKPGERVQAGHETHNVWLQVASEIGLFGFLTFTFLVVRGFLGVWQTRRLLARARAAAALARRRMPSRKAIVAPAVSEYDGVLLDGHSAAMAASLVGFFVCSFFSPIAYGWTFYYLLALAVAPRDILRALIPAPAGKVKAAATAGLSPAPLGMGARGARA